MSASGAAARVRGSVDDLRTRLWPVPVLGILAAVTLGVLLPRVDRAWQSSAGGDGAALHLFGGGADAARAVLSTIAGSLVTATSLIFSLTVVTLQLASSQYSPRLLRTFTRDGVVQVTLGLFLATFTYALAVLRVVRSRDTDSVVDEVFIPRLSVTVAVGLTLASVVTLALFLAHLAREIRVETVLARVHEESLGVIRRVYPLPASQDRQEGPAPTSPGRPVLASRTGFLTAVAQTDLRSAAREQRGLVVLGTPVGAFVVAGAPVGRAYADADEEALATSAARALTVEDERTAVQDPAFGLRQVVDVAVRALSPGVNDPTTAVHALGWAGALLVDLAGRECGPLVIHDDDGAVRAVVARPSFVELMTLGFEQPLRYGSTDPQVLAALATGLEGVARASTTPPQRISVRAWLARLRTAVDDTAQDSARMHVHELCDRVANAVEADRDGAPGEPKGLERHPRP